MHTDDQTRTQPAPRRRGLRIFFTILGGLLVLLGALWLVQGLGLVVIEPILCFANCEPVVGPAPGWSLAGLLSLALGGVALFLGLRRR